MTVRCPACRTRRATFTALLQHVKHSGHAVCRCGGYHYPHRPGSGCCMQSPMGAIRAAEREDAPTSVVLELVNDYLLTL